MAIKKSTFIEFDFIGKTSGKIFDLTLKDAAEKEGIMQKDHKYEPLQVCAGEGQIIPGLDEELLKHSVKDEFEVDITAEKAYGARNPNLIKLTPLSKFKDSEIMPFPGLQLNIDGATATVRSVNGGRVLLDFNHPLAGKTLHYWVRINRILEKDEEKLASMLKTTLGVPNPSIEIKEGKATVKFKNAEKVKNLAELFQKEVKRLIPSIRELKFSEK